MSATTSAPTPPSTKMAGTTQCSSVYSVVPLSSFSGLIGQPKYGLTTPAEVFEHHVGIQLGPEHLPRD